MQMSLDVDNKPVIINVLQAQKKLPERVPDSRHNSIKSPVLSHL